MTTRSYLVTTTATGRPLADVHLNYVRDAAVPVCAEFDGRRGQGYAEIGLEVDETGAVDGYDGVSDLGVVVNVLQAAGVRLDPDLLASCPPAETVTVQHTATRES